MAATKSVILMLMIASLASGALAVLLVLSIGAGSMLFISIPGFVVGAFFAFKYAMFNRSKAREEEHKRSRGRHRH
ncbi:MAG TPA: hypothetical protein VJZ68_03895 [Nitrososphaera sp.]|nr:hypothetical protein [Nitrososphaera sp.]